MLFYAVLLNFALYLSSCELYDASHGLAKKRLTRAAVAPPTPIDCTMSTWSSWSGCDPCEKKRYRYTQATQVSQFLGERCETVDREEQSCTTTSVCRKNKRCEGFQCVESGKCIPSRLKCNGDDDCEDFSDEKNCNVIRSTCTGEMEQFWSIENLGAGLNLFTNMREGFVLDHRYFGGGCAPHYILGTKFRKPYNVESYVAEGRGEYKFTLSDHSSYSDYKRDYLSIQTKQTSFSIGFAIPEVFEFGFSYSDSKFKQFVEKTRQYANTQSLFVNARSDLQVAKYKLRSRGWMLHSGFFQRVKQLPSEYVYSEYRDLFRDFGTHFITEATLGGVYEYTLILNKQHVIKEAYTLNDVKTCLSLGFSLGGNIEGVYISGSMSSGACAGLLKEIGDTTDNRKVVEDFAVLVRGGASEQIAALAFRELPTPDLMQEWGDAVYYNPEILNIKASPLYELVTATDFFGANVLQDNMKRALEEFQWETSSCRCTPCENNGIPVLKENRCECICPLGFKGSSCEITKRPAPAIDGAWSCWTAWTPCSGRTQTRQRYCNNPPPRNGGQPCSGPNSDSRSC
ncbi:complement component C8 beta chain [Hyperolius riggenbachi]|uniref:complement component C8 beta chain n=1 Tax=Hyperolius riggenbachi TaxID=752182 RepID=UPI0035A29492